MIQLTFSQFVGACVICGFAGAMFNELFSKVEEMYEDYKKKKTKQEQESN